MSDLNNVQRKRPRTPTDDDEKEEDEAHKRTDPLPLNSYEERQAYIQTQLQKYRQIGQTPGQRTREECQQQRQCLRNISRSIPPDPSPAPHPLVTQAQVVLQEHLGVSLEDVLQAVQERTRLPHGRCLNHRVDPKTGYTECFLPNPLKHEATNIPFRWRPSVEEENGRPMSPIYEP